MRDPILHGKLRAQIRRRRSAALPESPAGGKPEAFKPSSREQTVTNREYAGMSCLQVKSDVLAGIDFTPGEGVLSACGCAKSEF